MKRTIRKYYTLNRKEADDLRKKAKKTCRSEASLVRELILGYEPREKPDEEFYDAMKLLSEFISKLQLLISRSNNLEDEDVSFLKNEAKKWMKFQVDIEKRFLTGEEGLMRWQ